MHMQNDIAAAASKGPHFVEPKINPAVRSAEIDQVIAAATAAMPKATMRKLKTLSFAVAADDDDCSYFGQIRSEPMEVSGLEFRFPMPARDTGRRELTPVIDQLVQAARSIATDGPSFVEFADMVRETAERALTPVTGGLAGMRVVAVGITPELPGAPMRTTVDVEMLGSDLSPIIDRVVAHDVKRVEEGLAKLVALHLERRKALAQARVAGVTGWIDDAARLILQTAGVDIADVIRMLGTTPEVEFHFGGTDGQDVTGAVYWIDGTIRGYAEDRTRGAIFRLQTDQLTVEAMNVPVDERQGLIGRRVREVVDIPCIPASAIIVDVQESDPWIYLDLEIGRSTIEEAIAGTI